MKHNDCFSVDIEKKNQGALGSWTLFNHFSHWCTLEFQITFLRKLCQHVYIKLILAVDDEARSFWGGISVISSPLSEACNKWKIASVNIYSYSSWGRLNSACSFRETKEVYGAWNSATLFLASLIKSNQLQFSLLWFNF